MRSFVLCHLHRDRLWQVASAISHFQEHGAWRRAGVGCSLHSVQVTPTHSQSESITPFPNMFFVLIQWPVSLRATSDKDLWSLCPFHGCRICTWNIWKHTIDGSDSISYAFWKTLQYTHQRVKVNKANVFWHYWERTLTWWISWNCRGYTKSLDLHLGIIVWRIMI